MSIPHRLLALLLLLTLAARAEAQVGVHYDSLEALIVRAETVFHGSISKLKREVVVAAGQPLPNGTPYSDGVVRYTLSVAVDKVLKGEPPEQVQLVRTTNLFDKRWDEWQEAETPFLWFVGPDKQRDPWLGGPPRTTWRTIRLGDAVPAESRFSTPHAPPLFSMDLSVLREPSEILVQAMDFAREHGGASQIQVITISRALAHRCKPSGDANSLSLPVAAPLEKTARRMITAPGEFLPEGLDGISNFQLRVGGVRCLSHFKSDANIALLKSLLDNPTVVVHTYGQGKPDVRKYPIRAKAWEVLQAWNVDVPKPVTEVPAK